MLLRKDIYPYEYMDRYDETPLPDKETFYSELNVEHFIDKDNTHTGWISWSICPKWYIVASECISEF